VLVLFSYVRYFSSVNMIAIPITNSRSEYVLVHVLYTDFEVTSSWLPSFKLLNVKLDIMSQVEDWSSTSMV